MQQEMIDAASKTINTVVGGLNESNENAVGSAAWTAAVRARELEAGSPLLHSIPATYQLCKCGQLSTIYACFPSPRQEGRWY